MKIEKLIQLADMKYDRQKTIWNQLKYREQSIKAALGSLSCQSDVEWTMRTLGLDLAWYRWADQQRSALNIELARCLSAQADHRESVHKTFAQRQVLNTLTEANAQNKKKANTARDFDKLAEMFMAQSKDLDAQYQ